MNSNLTTRPHVAAQNDIRDAGGGTPTRPVALSPDGVINVKTIVEIGFALLRVVELAILFA